MKVIDYDLIDARAWHEKHIEDKKYPKTKTILKCKECGGPIQGNNKKFCQSCHTILSGQIGLEDSIFSV